MRGCDAYATAWSKANTQQYVDSFHIVPWCPVYIDQCFAISSELSSDLIITRQPFQVLWIPPAARCEQGLYPSVLGRLVGCRLLHENEKGRVVGFQVYTQQPSGFLWWFGGNRDKPSF